MNDMDAIDPDTLLLIATVNLCLGLVGGFVMHRSDYCMAGAFRDLFIFRQTFMLRCLFLFIVTSMVLVEIARQAHLLPLYPSPIVTPPNLTNILGGAIFGTAMVLAGGCVVGTVYKMGSGSLVSAAAFAGLIAGSGLYAEIQPWWQPLAASMAFVKDKKATIPQFFDFDPLYLVLAAAVPSFYLLFRWHREGALVRQAWASGYVQPWKTSLVLAVVLVCSWILVGMPLGITTSYAKIAAWIETLFWREHAETLAFFQ